MRRGHCIHREPYPATRCKAGVEYPIPGPFPCSKLDMRGQPRHGLPFCKSFEEPTEAQIASHEAAIRRTESCIARGVSPCCEAPLDTSQVMKAGRYKGHGPRLCSKCGQCVFMV